MMENKEKQELLVITMEECAEVIKECSKMIRFNVQNDNNMLELEIGDLMCMVELLTEYGMIDMGQVAIAARAKREKLKQWSNLNV